VASGDTAEHMIPGWLAGWQTLLPAAQEQPRSRSFVLLKPIIANRRCSLMVETGRFTP